MAPTAGVYIISDMEGATGIVDPGQCEPGTAPWWEARAEITRDVNAAIRGARGGGATRIVVRDSHAHGFNLLRDDLEPDIEYLGGQFAGPVPIFGELLGTDLAFYIAGHARASTPAAFTPHTLRYRFVNLLVNGKPVCEVELFGALLGRHGIRMGLFTGEEVAADQAAECLPWIKRVAIPKDRATYEKFGGLIQSRIRERIERAAREAVEWADRMPPFVYQDPVRLEVQYKDEQTARRENRWDYPREGAKIRLPGEHYQEVFENLIKIGYFSPRTWPLRGPIFFLYRWFQGLRAGCLP